MHAIKNVSHNKKRLLLHHYIYYLVNENSVTGEHDECKQSF